MDNYRNRMALQRRSTTGRLGKGMRIGGGRDWQVAARRRWGITDMNYQWAFLPESEESRRLRSGAGAELDGRVVLRNAFCE